MALTTKRLKVLFLLAFGLSVPVALANSAGPSPGYTGAPGEPSCRQCHTTAPLNDGVGSVTIEGVPEQYVAAQGTAIGRRGRVHVRRLGDEVWVGGATVTTIRGEVHI